MGLTKFNARRIAARALITFAAGAMPMAVLAGEVTLKSSDGTVNLVGEFIDYKDDNYVIRTGLGDLRIAASRVRCEGASCPSFETVAADIQISGSETVGQGMMPLLMSGYASHLNAEASVVATETQGQILANFVGDGGYGDEMGSYLVTSTTSSDAFTTLLDGTAQVGMSSRRIRPDEARTLRDGGAGNMISAGQEHIIAVDSLVVITHPSNPIKELTLEQLRGVYTGQITNWSELGGEDAPITFVGRQEGTGTRSVFEERIFGNNAPTVTARAKVAEDSSALASMVNADPHALGYVGYAFQRGAKPLTLINECGIAMKPDAFSAKTEEYALQRRMYLYNRGDAIAPSAQEFIDYAVSSDADGVIAKAGFIDLGIARREQSLDGDRARALLDPKADPYEGGVMREMLAEMVNFDRLSTTFRFATGSSRLDERGRFDMARLADYLETQPAGTTVKIVGFTDGVGAFDSNRALSQGRAAQIKAELEAFAGDRIGSLVIEAAGFGEIGPSACNIDENGRAINRRVEVWIETARG